MSTGRLAPLALTQSSAGELSLATITTSCASRERRQSPVSPGPFLPRPVVPLPSFATPSLFHMFPLPSSSAPVCHQLTFPVCQNGLGFFHAEHEWCPSLPCGLKVCCVLLPLPSYQQLFLPIPCSNSFKQCPLLADSALSNLCLLVYLHLVSLESFSSPFPSSCCGLPCELVKIASFFFTFGSHPTGHPFLPFSNDAFILSARCATPLHSLSLLLRPTAPTETRRRPSPPAPLSFLLPPKPR